MVKLIILISCFDFSFNLGMTLTNAIVSLPKEHSLVDFKIFIVPIHKKLIGLLAGCSQSRRQYINLWYVISELLGKSRHSSLVQLNLLFSSYSFVKY